MTALVKYDAACAALAAAVSVDEVMEIRDSADMMRAAARIAKNRDLEMQAIELRMRGERKLGELITAQKETVGLAKGGTPYKASSTGAVTEQVDRPATLAEAGIDRKLSSRAQKLAAMPQEKFESTLQAWREESASADVKLTTNLLAVGAEDEQRQHRRNLAQTLSDTSANLTGQRKVACIYADPAVRRKAGIGGRAYENHYPTMTWDEIMALPVKSMLLPDAWGFIWLPRAHVLALHPVVYKIDIGAGEIVEATIKIPLAWAIARAWGFDDYSTMHVWSKTDEDHPDDMGTGLIWRDQNEILCLFKKGNGLPMPAAAEKYTSEHRERSKPLGHSRKPQAYREMIASMTGGIPVIELFARHDAQFPLPPNWEAWGNQAQDTADSEAA